MQKLKGKKDILFLHLALILLTLQLTMALHAPKVFFFLKYNKNLIFIACSLYPILIGVSKKVCLNFAAKINFTLELECISLIFSSLPYRLLFFNIQSLRTAILIIPIKMIYKFLVYFCYPLSFNKIEEIKYLILKKLNLIKEIEKKNSKRIFDENMRNLIALKLTLLEIVDIMNIINLQIIIGFFRIIQPEGLFYGNINRKTYWIIFYQSVTEICCEIFIWIFFTFSLKKKILNFKDFFFISILDNYLGLIYNTFQFVYFIAFIILGNNYVQEI